MKAEELMIGDWVQNQDGSIKGRIVNIDAYQNRVEFGAYTIDADFVYPIPLTSDILNKNKFPYAPKASGYFVGDLFLKGNGDIGYSCGANIRIDNGDGIVSGIYYTFAKIRYVHELQHLLKLCKIEREIIL